ncbi:TolC family protein [Fortiea contorta]|uniref:TolC family protein n=1 Tax=Fortiea contorta TaxID=1892405 RepID=UPI0003471C37|nr:TolC family protein [Fortiea contorta]
MKGQQLFHSFLPSVTAAVLTTQPTWAASVKVNGVELVSSPSVVTSTHGQAVVADATKAPFGAASKITSSAQPYPEWIFDHLQPTVRETRSGLTTGQTPKAGNSQFFSLASPSYPIQQPNQNSAVKPPAVQTTFALISAQPQINQNNYSPPQNTSTSKHSAAKLLETASCTRGKAAECLQKISSENWLAQNPPTQPGNINPVVPTAPVQIPPTNINPVVPTAPVQIPPTNINPGSTAPVQIPDSLNQNPNPLLYPTKSEEVVSQSNQPITLAQALELARRNNRDLQVAELQLERSRAALRESQAALFPTVGIEANGSRGRSSSSTLNEKLGGPRAQDTTSFSGQAQLQYNIYTSGQRQASIRAAEEQVRISEFTVERQSEEIRLNVSTEYYDLQQADEQVRINTSAVQNSRVSLRDAEALERAGVGTRFDVLRSQVNLANANQDLTNALSQQQIARRRLATRLSLPQLATITAADPVQLAGLWNQSLEQSIVLAFQNRPELQEQLAQRNISEQQRRQALASLGPQISLVASYDLLDRFDDGVNISDGYSLGVRATLNLFDGGAARARAAQQRANIAIAETNFASQRDQIRFQVENAFYTQRSNLDNVQTSNTALEQAREALRLARLRFQAGVGTQIDVINSENDLTRAEGNRVRAILDYNRALAQLQRSVTSRAFR